jgi:uncharacterized protein
MRVAGKRYRDEWLPNFFPAREVREGCFLRLSRTGATVTMSGAENAQLDEICMDEQLFDRLERTGHIVTTANALRVLGELKRWHQNTYSGPQLHIVVLTKRCNLDCTYCHMNPEPVSADRGAFDLKPEMAREIVRFALESPSPRITFEFQGGEPFLNFPGMVHFVEEARRQNRSVGKEIDFAVVTNLMVASDEHLAFCRDNGVAVSYTLNGPAPINDLYRKTRRGLGSHAVVMERLAYVQSKFPGLVATMPLCVIDAQNASQLAALIDYFYDGGFSGLALIRLKHLGSARRQNLDLSIHEFITHYVRGLDIIFEKNRPLGRVFIERMVPVALAKIFSMTDVGFVDWRNPSGDLGGSITYDHDGEILPNDDARSLRAEFGLGKVMGVRYEDLVRRQGAFRAMNLSLRDRDAACRECAYNPYCGVMPVLEFARTGSAVPRPHESDECLFTLALLDWTFKKLLREPLPLVRMLDGADAYLKTLVRRTEAHPEGGGDSART